MNSKTINIITWVLQGIMTLVFLMAGGMKVFTPFDQYVETMPYAAKLSAGIIKLIGTLEILGAIGMSLPFWIKKWYFLSPLAALGLAATMIGAIVTHAGRNEPFVMQIAFFAILVIIAFVRNKQIKAAR
ncbi:DoxX family protein [Owenweeksia hongkongensis]|uniref:DoxX family protein n=1 Tax=Owenweeksia hongkongensis TaxID=253245 RepID=UPI003A90A9BD